MRKLEIGYLSISFDRAWWRFMGYRPGVFRNLPEVIPGRWGVYWGGIEFGSRNSGNHVGVWLKNHGLWPW